MERVVISKTILWEKIDSDVLVANQDTREAFTLSGSLAAEFLAIASGKPRSSRNEDQAELLALGLITTSGSSPLPSRRNVVLGGAAAIGASVVALSLPSVAAASSPAATFTVPDNFFTHLHLNLVDFTGLEIMNNLPRSLLEISTDLFVVGEEWTLSVGPFDDSGATETRTAVVTVGTAPRTFLRFLIAAPTDVFAATVFQGQLSRGSERSNVFNIPRYVAP